MSWKTSNEALGVSLNPMLTGRGWGGVNLTMGKGKAEGYIKSVAVSELVDISSLSHS